MFDTLPFPSETLPYKVTAFIVSPSIKSLRLLYSRDIESVSIREVIIWSKVIIFQILCCFCVEYTLRIVGLENISIFLVTPSDISILRDSYLNTEFENEGNMFLDDAKLTSCHWRCHTGCFFCQFIDEVSNIQFHTKSGMVEYTLSDVRK